jgi:hypothetical protein
LNIIFCPKAKYFVIPVLMIYEHYKIKGEKALVICDNTMSESFESYGFNEFITTNLFDLKSIKDSYNLVFFHHNTKVNKDFFINSILSLRQDLTSLNISYMPDGLGNAMYGDGYIDSVKSITSITLFLKHVFSFGFIHHTVCSTYPEKNIVCLNYSYIEKYLDNTQINFNTSQAIDTIKEFNSVVFIPYRPWCTEKFHGGVYDFGSNESLSKIYSSLIEEVKEKYELQNYIVIFRGDSRFRENSNEVFNGISFDNKIMLDEMISDHVTLEPFIYKSLKTTKCDFYYITLDSTTFQCAPFFYEQAGKNKKMICLVGCHSIFLTSIKGGMEFCNKKLKGKVKDFYSRYESMKNTGFVTSINYVEESCFYVEI